MSTHIIGNDFQKVSFDTSMGGRATSWIYNGLELLAQPNEANLFGGNYVMAPWGGRLLDARINFQEKVYVQPINNHPWAIHGSTPFHEPTVIEHDATQIVFEHNLEYELINWPTGFKVRHSWKVQDSKLITYIDVRSEHFEIPVVVGWHPWFLRTLSNGAIATYDITATGELATDESQIVTGEIVPTSEGPWDTTFIAPTGVATIAWSDSLRIDVKTNSKFFVLYDKLAEYVCIEPMSGSPNGNNLIDEGFGTIVSPGNPLHFEAIWSVSSHS